MNRRTATALGAEHRRFFEEPNFAHLATMCPDGKPHVAPVWVDIEDDVILVNTAKDRVKERNMRREPRVALSVSDQDNPYKMVAIQGRVVEMTSEGADEHIDELARKYLNQERYPQEGRGERVLVRIVPESVATMGV